MPHDTVYNNISMKNPPVGPDKLDRLITLAKSGDQEAFTQLYNQFFVKIYTFIYFRVSHKEVAEDICEDVFIKVFHSLRKLEKQQSFESWLYQIARNKVIDYYRSKKMIVPLDEVENTLEYETNVVDIIDLEVQQKVFLKALKELASDQQAVIKMKFLEELENDVIALALGKTEGTVRVIQHRAIIQLKILIDSYNDESSI